MRHRQNLARPIVLLGLALLCFVTAQGTGIRLFIHLTYLLLALLILSYAWAWLNLRGLRVVREASIQRAQVGDVVRERLVIENLWPFPRLWIEVHDHSDLPQHGGGLVTYLPAFGRRRWTSRTPCTMRGKFSLGPATLASGDPFGIFRVEHQFADTNEIIVYPRTVDLARFELPVAELSGGPALRSRTYQTTPSVAGVREYAPGDGFNRIHWRTTARTGQMMVKEFELDPNAEIYLALDMQERVHQVRDEGPMVRQGRELRSPESSEEYAVQAAASIARYLLNGRRSVGLMAWGQHHELILPDREERQLWKMLEALAVMRAHGTHPLAELLIAEGLRLGRNSTLLIITPSTDSRWVTVLQQLLYRGVRAAVVLVDPRSFGSWHDPVSVLEQLAALRVPTYVLRQGQALDAALALPQ